ncbi:MAG: hypothetical protein QG553_770 [Patescibacteria group bacterium]|nr:hypothetical protein [Patescibacteria group bacterium]
MGAISLRPDVAESLLLEHGRDALFAQHNLAEIGIIALAHELSGNPVLAHDPVVHEELRLFNDQIVPRMGSTIFRVSGLVQFARHPHASSQQPPSPRDMFKSTDVAVTAAFAGIHIRDIQSPVHEVPASYLGISFDATGFNPRMPSFGIPVIGSRADISSTTLTSPRISHV